jgi:hypothetical protein
MFHAPPYYPLAFVPITYSGEPVPGFQGDRSVGSMPLALQEHGVTEEEWAQFAQEAEETMRFHGDQFHCDRYQCLWSLLPPFLWFFAIGALEEWIVETKSDISIDYAILAGKIILVLYFLAVFIHYVCRQGTLEKAMEHDIDELSQRIFSQHTIRGKYYRGSSPSSSFDTPADKGSPHGFAFIYYGDDESLALLEEYERSMDSLAPYLMLIAGLFFALIVAFMVGPEVLRCIVDTHE